MDYHTFKCSIDFRTGETHVVEIFHTDDVPPAKPASRRLAPEAMRPEVEATLAADVVDLGAFRKLLGR